MWDWSSFIGAALGAGLAAFVTLYVTSRTRADSRHKDRQVRLDDLDPLIDAFLHSTVKDHEADKGGLMSGDTAIKMARAVVAIRALRGFATRQDEPVFDWATFKLSQMSEAETVGKAILLQASILDGLTRWHSGGRAPAWYAEDLVKLREGEKRKTSAPPPSDG